jgi:hypothetical protein
VSGTVVPGSLGGVRSGVQVYIRCQKTGIRVRSFCLSYLVGKALHPTSLKFVTRPCLKPPFQICNVRYCLTDPVMLITVKLFLCTIQCVPHNFNYLASFRNAYFFLISKFVQALNWALGRWAKSWQKHPL